MCLWQNFKIIETCFCYHANFKLDISNLTSICHFNNWVMLILAKQWYQIFIDMPTLSWVQYWSERWIEISILSLKKSLNIKKLETKWVMKKIIEIIFKHVNFFV